MLKKIVGSGNGSSSSASHNHPLSTTLIISNDEIEYITNIVKSLDDSGWLLKVSDVVQNEAKAFLSILLGTLGACLLGNILADRGKNRAGEGVVRAGYGCRCSKNKKTGF